MVIYGLRLRDLISAFLIHYTKLADRLPNAMEALEVVGLTPEIVSCWDGDRLLLTHFADKLNQSAWIERTKKIAPILLKNAGYTQDYCANKLSVIRSMNDMVNVLPAWMHPRLLSDGEISVILKHYYALSRIAQGQDSYGLVAEDDIILKNNSKRLFYNSLEELKGVDGDYLDLAGGCGLKLLGFESPRNISNIKPANTRTNACYVVSKHLAKLLVESFLPFVHPIDWHLLYLLNYHDVDKCYWSIEEVFIHGSESGRYSSWRSE